jgi:hypothetical protein
MGFLPRGLRGLCVPHVVSGRSCLATAGVPCVLDALWKQHRNQPATRGRNFTWASLTSSKPSNGLSPPLIPCVKHGSDGVKGACLAPEANDVLRVERAAGLVVLDYMCALRNNQANRGHAYSATKMLRIVTGFRVGNRSRGRFATPADFPRHDCTPYPHVHGRRACGIRPSFKGNFLSPRAKY